MADKIRVTWQDLSVGRKLPWNVYSETGKLLLSAGHIIASEQILDNMRQYILYRDELESGYGKDKGSRGIVNPFSKVEDFVSRLEHIFKDIETGNDAANSRLGRLVKDLIRMCTEEPDAAIATVHLPNNYSYCAFHSIQCAILCFLIGKHIDMPGKELQMLCGAALVANVGMRELQDQLFTQGGKASDEQTALIKQHPERSTVLIKAVGIENKYCLDVVLMHHEYTNGKGYPNGLHKEQIVRGALILAVADRYGAMVTMRDYREPIPVKDSLKSFLIGKGKEYDEEYSMLLIKVLSVYPPGSFVRLQNGETAIVVQRGKMNPMEPVLKSLEGEDGRRFSNPLLRDCGANDYRITGVCGYDKNIPLNLNRLWDYI